MTTQTPLPLRNDTILGVCEAIGQDFGFNPLWLRLGVHRPDLRRALSRRSAPISASA